MRLFQMTTEVGYKTRDLVIQAVLMDLWQANKKIYT